MFKPNPVCVIFDATFFGRSYGILIARAEGKNLLWKEIDGEKIRYYEEILHELVSAEFTFLVLLLTEEEESKSFGT